MAWSYVWKTLKFAPHTHTQNLLEVINDPAKLQDIKSIYTNEEQLEKEMEEQISLQ